MITTGGSVKKALDAVEILAAADAEDGQAVGTGGTGHPAGSGSSDPENDPLSFSWSRVVPAGSSATLDSTNIVNPTFVADVDGTYVASLVVNDGTSDSDPDSLEIVAEAAT